MAGIIAGALGGLGQGMAATGQLYGAQAMEDQRNKGAMDLAQMQSDLALKREQALEQFRSQMQVSAANQQRTDMAARINSAKQGIIGSAMDKRYGASDAAVADADSGQTDAPLTNEQRSVIQQAKDGTRQALEDSPDTYIKAATQTGDLDPKTIANNASHQEIAALKAEGYQRSIEAKLEAAKDRTEMIGLIANMRIEAAKAGGAEGGKLPSDAKMIDYLEKGGMSHQDAVDRVMGTGAGKTKDPVGMTASLASTLIASGAVRVPKDAPPGVTVASLAMKMAADQIAAAEERFNSKPSPAQPPAPATSTSPTATAPNPFNQSRPPLSSFRK